MMPILVTGDDVRSENKDNARHGRLWDKIDYKIRLHWFETYVQYYVTRIVIFTETSFFRVFIQLETKGKVVFQSSLN